MERSSLTELAPAEIDTHAEILYVIKSNISEENINMTHHTYSITFGTGKDKAVAKVRVVKTASLFELADVLLTAIGFDLDHAFGFHSSLKNP